MGDIIQEQIHFFLQAIGAGLFLRCCYDIFLLLRRILKHNSFWVGAEDMAYWIGCCLAVFALLYRENDGMIRGFVLVGVFLGMILYHKGPSGYVVEAFYRVWQVIQKIIRMILNILKKPFQVFIKFWKKSLQKAANCFKLKKRNYEKRRKDRRNQKHGKKNQSEKKEPPGHQRIRKKVRKEASDAGNSGAGHTGGSYQRKNYRTKRKRKF